MIARVQDDCPGPQALYYLEDLAVGLYCREPCPLVHAARVQVRVRAVESHGEAPVRKGVPHPIEVSASRLAYVEGVHVDLGVYARRQKIVHPGQQVWIRHVDLYSLVLSHCYIKTYRKQSCGYSIRKNIKPESTALFKSIHLLYRSGARRIFVLY